MCGNELYSNIIQLHSLGNELYTKLLHSARQQLLMLKELPEVMPERDHV